MIKDLVTNNLHHLKALRRRDRVDEHVPMNANEMLRVQYAVFILSSKSSAKIKYHFEFEMACSLEQTCDLEKENLR